MKILKITKVKPRLVYAIKTSTNTFIADGLAHHNCSSCNVIHNTNPAPFTLAILKKYGTARITHLNKTAKEAVGKKISLSTKRELLKELTLDKQSV